MGWDGIEGKGRTGPCVELISFETQEKRKENKKQSMNPVEPRIDKKNSGT